MRIVPWAPPESSAPAQAAAGTVGRDARRAGLALRRAGVNVSLAPVADVPSVAGSCAGQQVVLQRPEAGEHGRGRGRGRLARRRRRRRPPSTFPDSEARR